MHDQDHRLGNAHGLQYGIHEPHLVRQAVGEGSGRLGRSAVAWKIRRDAPMPCSQPGDQRPPLVGIVGIAVQHDHRRTRAGLEHARTDAEPGERDGVLVHRDPIH
jgi:hypothetical protein